MNSTDPVQRTQALPGILPDILRQIAEKRAAKGGASDGFEKQMKRLVARELKPRGMFLHVRELYGGRIRFIIRDSETHAFIHMLDFFPQASRG